MAYIEITHLHRMNFHIDKSGLFRYRIEWERAVSLILMFDVFIAAAQARELELDQRDYDDEDDLLKPPGFVFSIRAVIESKGPIYCRSILKFSWEELLQLDDIMWPEKFLDSEV
jgi:hypothetical protein